MGTIKVGDRVTNAVDLANVSDTKRRHVKRAGTLRGVVLRFGGLFGRPIVRWEGDTAPGADKGREADPRTLRAVR